MKEEARVLEIEYWQEYDAFTKGSPLNKAHERHTGANVASNLVFAPKHREIISIEMYSQASCRLEGLPVGVTSHRT